MLALRFCANDDVGGQSECREIGGLTMTDVTREAKGKQATALVTDEKERERIRAARIEARRAAELPNLRREAAERRARVDRVLEQAGASTAKREAKTAEHTAERVAKARRQAGQRLLLRALRLISPDERDEAVAKALRQA